MDSINFLYGQAGNVFEIDNGNPCIEFPLRDMLNSFTFWFSNVVGLRANDPVNAALGTMPTKQYDGVLPRENSYCQKF